MPPTWVRVILKERLECQGLRTLERHSHATPAKLHWMGLFPSKM